MGPRLGARLDSATRRSKLQSAAAARLSHKAFEEQEDEPSMLAARGGLRGGYAAQRVHLLHDRPGSTIDACTGHTASLALNITGDVQSQLGPVPLQHQHQQEQPA